MIDPRRDLGLLVLICGMAVVAAGYPSYLAHPVTLLAPVPLLVALLVLDDGRLESPPWVVSAVALAIWAALLYLAMAGTATGLAHSFAMYLPFAALGFRIERAEPVALTFAVVTTILLSARVVVSWIRSGAEWVPWAVYEGNDLASRLNMLLPLLVVVMVALPAGHRRDRGLIVLLIVAGVTSVALTQSRIGLAVLAVLVMLGLARNYWKALPVIGAAMLVAWLVASASIVALLERTRFVNFVPSSASRPEIWRVAIDALRETAWLGVGPGRSDDALRDIDDNHAHNGLVQAALEAGWPGALLYTALAVYLIVLACRLLQQGGRDTLWALPMLAYQGFSVVSAPTQRPDGTLVLVLVVMAARQHLRPRGVPCRT